MRVRIPLHTLTQFESARLPRLGKRNRTDGEASQDVT